MSAQRIAVVGAGFAGLAAAKVLTAFGHDVTVYDRTPDVGGVWSRTRRYPGLTTQNGKDTYAMSDFPMPAHYPEWPTGEQVQLYLAAYATHFGLDDLIHLQTEVLTADLDPAPGPDRSWTVTLQAVGPDGTSGTERFDHLVVANGIFCDPAVPGYPGVEEFTAAGGRVCHASQFTRVEDAQDRDVLVIGYGKSSCDVAAALSTVARSTTVVARDLLWKMPRKIAGVVNYKYLLLTRLGEGLFPYLEPRGAERFLHGPGRGVRDGLLGSLQGVVLKQLDLTALGLVPRGGLERIARSTVSLVTEGFYEGVAEGSIGVRRDEHVARLATREGRPVAELSDGSILPADLVVCGTGFHQRVPFLSPSVQQQLHDERGNVELYRQILPHEVPALTFCGYNSSFFSPLSAEVAALWIAHHLDGGIALPTLPQRRAHVTRRLRWMEERTEGRHARGTNIIPFSIHNIDEMLSDLPVRPSRRVRLLEWLLPLRPGSYARFMTPPSRRGAVAADRTRTPA